MACFAFLPRQRTFPVVVVTLLAVLAVSPVVFSWDVRPDDSGLAFTAPSSRVLPRMTSPAPGVAQAPFETPKSLNVLSPFVKAFAFIAAVVSGSTAARMASGPVARPLNRVRFAPAVALRAEAEDAKVEGKEENKAENEDDDIFDDEDEEDSDDDVSEDELAMAELGYADEDDEDEYYDDEEEPELQATCKAKGLRGSHLKFERVLWQIRGRSYRDALMMLEFMPWAACRPVLKAVQSAAANAQNQFNMDKSRLYISYAIAGKAQSMKRARASSKGGFAMYTRHYTNLLIRVAERETDEED